MLETNCVGEKFRILVSVFVKLVPNIPHVTYATYSTFKHYRRTPTPKGCQQELPPCLCGQHNEVTNGW